MRWLSWVFILAMQLASGLPQASAETHLVTIGAEDDWFPYSGKIKGSAHGLAVDIVAAAYAASGIKVKFEVLPYARCMFEVRNGRLLACFDIPRTSAVENDYLWHDTPLYSASALIYAQASSKEQGLTPKDLIGKRIATTSTYGYGEGFDGNQAILQEPNSRDILGLRQLIHGRVPYFACFDRAMSYLESQYPDVRGKTRPVGLIANTEIYMAFSKRFPESEMLLQKFNAGMAQIIASGEYQRILSTWDERFPLSYQPEKSSESP